MVVIPGGVAWGQANTMPPGGIADEEQRQTLLALAREFEVAADTALRLEGEPIAP
jgi:hypothetical protein